MFDKCKYWAVDEEEYVDENEITHLFEPSGYFDAKQINAIENSPQVISGVFMFDSNRTTIQTNDDVEDIQKNYLVEFRNEIWRVENVQRTPIRKNYQFSEEVTYTYYLRLKR